MTSMMGKSNLTEDEAQGVESEAAAQFAEDLSDFARRYYAKDFPNPARLDCPHPEFLASLLKAGRLPDDKLRAHLFGCSECFTEYREALAERRAQGSAAQRTRWWSRIVGGVVARPIPAVAGAATLLLVMAGVAYLRQKGPRASG